MKSLALMFWLLCCVSSSAQTTVDHAESEEALRPVVAGYGADTFEVGDLLYETDFSDSEHWDVQLQAKPDSPLQPRISLTGGMLDVYAADVGCTVWLKQKFSEPVAIVYRMRCPLETQQDKGIMPRDANNFWMASDPDPKGSLFDRQRYTGDFGDYNEMNAYYCSSGGRKNTSTRLRRYPREVGGESVPHIALVHQDKKQQYLLSTGKWHTVQLVAFEDIVQYFFDEQLVYQVRQGDEVRVEQARKGEKGNYELDRFPAHTEGYVGLRMVNTHHQYKDFKVYRLDAK